MRPPPVGTAAAPPQLTPPPLWDSGTAAGKPSAAPTAAHRFPSRGLSAQLPGRRLWSGRRPSPLGKPFPSNSWTVCTQVTCSRKIAFPPSVKSIAHSPPCYFVFFRPQVQEAEVLILLSSAYLFSDLCKALSCFLSSSSPLCSFLLPILHSRSAIMLLCWCDVQLICVWSIYCLVSMLFNLQMLLAKSLFFFFSY